MDIKRYIQDLFGYLDRYETASAQFETEAFLQTYNGIIAVLHSLRDQRNDAMAVDHFLLERIQAAPLTSSDLRLLTVQVLITYFESEADTDGQTNQAYSYCRGLRAVKQDIPYFENHLLPAIFEEGSLGNNLRLREFLVAEIARYMGKFGRPIDPGITPEKFQAMPDHLKVVELTRRRLELGTDLMADRTSLEFHLQRVDAFTRWSAKNAFVAHLLTKWGYLKTSDFWSRVKSGFAGLLGKMKGAFSSFGYFRLIMNQRNPAYVFYGVLIVVFVFLAIYVPMKWQQYGQEQLQEFQQRTQQSSNAGGR
ncbi:MAG: hypothetical protein KKA42_04480 [candidate division Zixibacteria bacterium]|nr:hypothetical protein [candidate division Zixibacteria bacterium]